MELIEALDELRRMQRMIYDIRCEMTGDCSDEDCCGLEQTVIALELLKLNLCLKIEALRT